MGSKSHPFLAAKVSKVENPHMDCPKYTVLCYGIGKQDLRNLKIRGMNHTARNSENHATQV
jgi:hypothetical protein